VAVLSGALLLTKQRADRAADQSVARALTFTQRAIEALLASRSEALLKVTQGFVMVPTFVSRIEEGIRTDNRSNLLDQADEFSAHSGAWILITDNRGSVKAWTLRPDLFDEDLSGGSLVGLALEGELTEGTWIEPGPYGDVVFQAVGVPIFDPARAKIHGVLVAALPVDSTLAEDLKSRTDSEVVFFALNTQGVPYEVLSTLPAGTADASLTTITPDELMSTSGSGGEVRMTVNQETLIGVAGPLLTAAGYPLGGYVGFRSRELELAAYTRLQQTILFTFVGGLLLALLSSLVVARRISRPLLRLVEATRAVSDGDYSGSIDISSPDEIGQLASAFRRMLRDLREKDELVAYLRAPVGLADRSTGTSVAEVTAADESVERPPEDISKGSVLAGPYEIKEKVGAGGMGDVYRAYDRTLGEVVAIKTIRPEALAHDTTLLERFKREIRYARSITHSTVVRTHDIGEEHGAYYITMEFVEGTTLKQLIDGRGQLPVTVALTIGKQLCRALEAAHEKGVIHRDIKPQNLLVDRRGSLKVMDFGIARLVIQPLDVDEGITATHSIVGTPGYMAPEQLMGDEIDERADIYGAGAVLFECVTGRSVFGECTLPGLMAKHVAGQLEDPRALNPSIPESLSCVILKALAEHRDARWQSAAELGLALNGVELESDGPPPANRASTE
ncbi:MAG: protein kinase, partial [Actinobacteria bacterium]|nr:protein kinase [Actinomycetota bacterium]